MVVPAGFGLIFHETIVNGMTQNGVDFSMKEAALSMIIPGVGMLVGLLIAVFITYRKDRDAIPGAGGAASTINIDETKEITFNRQHAFTIIAIIAALVVQIITENLIAGALTGLIFMF